METRAQPKHGRRDPSTGLREAVVTCTATARVGRPSRRRAMRGSEVCHAHSGAAVGRPSELTPERHHQIVQLVKAGCPGEVAVRAAGISSSTWYEIKKRGREEDVGPCRELLNEVDRRRRRPTRTR